MKTKTAIISSLFLSFLTLGFSASAIGQADETATDSQKTVVTQESERETDSILASAVERFEVPDATLLRIVWNLSSENWQTFSGKHGAC